MNQRFAASKAVLSVLSLSLAICVSTHAATGDKPLGILLAAGDISSCANNQAAQKTGDLIQRQLSEIEKMTPGVPVRVLVLGDLVYPCGATRGFECFQKAWGPFKDKMLPVPRNHEYLRKRGTPPEDICVPKDGKPQKSEKHAKPFFKYFETNTRAKPADGYYGVKFPDPDRGPWLLVGLNPYAGGAKQLDAFLQSNENKTISCTLAFSHHPYYSSGKHGHKDTRSKSAPLYVLRELRSHFPVLYERGVSVLLSGHDHHYEQLGSANAAGRPKDHGESAMVKDGVRSFVVGTGGTSLHKAEYTQHTWRFREAYDLYSHGILRIELYERSYRWRFVAPGGDSATLQVITDVSEDTCNQPR